MSDEDARAVATAAKIVGIRPDQVAAAVAEYRSAAAAIEDEPDWRPRIHMSSADTGLAQYVAEETAVTLQIESWKVRDGWQSKRYYVYRDKPYEFYAEARAIELAATARPRPHTV